MASLTRNRVHAPISAEPLIHRFGLRQKVARLLVADEDNTVVSGFFKTVLRSEQANEFIAECLVAGEELLADEWLFGNCGAEYYLESGD